MPNHAGRQISGPPKLQPPSKKDGKTWLNITLRMTPEAIEKLYKISAQRDERMARFVGELVEDWINAQPDVILDNE